MEPMARPASQVDSRIASLALAVIDLRAHFEAQLRRVARAEEMLVTCRTPRDRAAFESSAAALRGEVQVVSDNNRSIRAVIDRMDVDARELVFTHKR
jgi:hypothetical protein